ncbi:VOC family protein [Streptomyces sp. NPDC086554]|uniref:VOC family protein n=1 Tax=Streptomyces sp. NPDC086554 TaxID=3154864 RepID=UPI003427FEE4
MAPIARMRSIVLDCPDPRQLAEFYGHLLDGAITDDDADWVALRTPDGLRICFQRVAGHRPPDWPRAETNSQQLHLDFDAGPTLQDIERAQERVLAIGAKPLDVNDDGGERDFRVYADPAGHPFCLCRISESEGVSQRSGGAAPEPPAR